MSWRIKLADKQYSNKIYDTKEQAVAAKNYYERVFKYLNVEVERYEAPHNE